MSSLVRTAERIQQKDSHKRFKRSWGAERARQVKVLALGGKLGENERQLGKCPPFSHWKKMVDKLQQDTQDKLKKERDDRDKRVDLNWDEEPASVGGTES